MAKHENAMLSLLFACAIAGLQAGASATVEHDISALRGLMRFMDNMPPGWGRSNDPCGSQPWEGITCTDSRVTVIKLYNMGIKGKLSGDIGTLTALKILDLSYNKNVGSQLTPAIGALHQLEALILVGCSFSGNIPSEIGSLTKLTFLALNSNKFNGTIPASLGNLPKLSWLDLADNQLTGSLPVSNGTVSGLDQLVNTKHFHLNKNRLSGLIPEKLFSSTMQLKHLLLDRNMLDGMIPASIGNVQTLQIIRLDNNLLSGRVPSNINNLTSLHVLNLANNGLIGPIPNLTGLNGLNIVDLSNNSFDPSEAPAWISNIENLTTLAIESGRLHGLVPQKLFSFPQLQHVILRNNSFNGTLDMGSNISEQLQVVNLQNNALTSIVLSSGYNNLILLNGNPVCSNIHLLETDYCSLSHKFSSAFSTGLTNCDGKFCSTNTTCSHAYEGVLSFRAPFFQNLRNESLFQLLVESVMEKYGSNLGSLTLRNPFFNNDSYLEVHLIFCSSNGGYFGKNDILELLDLSSYNYTAPQIYGPAYFIAFPYFFPGSHKNIGLIVGLAIGCAFLVLGLACAGFYALWQRRRANKAILMNNPFAAWEASFNDNGEAPQLMFARFFSFEELKKCTNNFPEINAIGSGGYGKVYRGVLVDGRMVAIKRSKTGSSQGALEFKTEIELLSRLHHKNLVGLVGFCFHKREKILVYEYVPNGSLRGCLAGRSGLQLDWMRRLGIALDSAKGLAYLHELADPPIIHRDVKSSNILLDENLNAKVADFGLSKLITDDQLDHIYTEVKGTMGYLDPEYYMTQRLTEKSDVYSFGVVMLELITGDPPIHKGQYIVAVVKSALNMDDVYYGLKEIMDPVIKAAVYPLGFRRIVELALLCVQETAADRPTMSDVVKEIEFILKTN